MTLETPPNPRHVALCAELLEKLESGDVDTDEDVINVRIVRRHRIARKVKWTYEAEECFP